MPRIQIKLPEHFAFTTELTVRVSDLNYGNHLGHDTVLTLLQEARIVYYNALGFKDELSFEGSIGQVIADAAVQYKSEAFRGDVLVIDIGIDDVQKFGFDMVYRMRNRATGKDVALAKTGIVCMDYATRKIAPIPTTLLSKLTTNS